MTVDLPVLIESRVSHSSLLLSAWTLAVAFVENSNDVLIANEVGGRVNSFPGDAGPGQHGYGGGREVFANVWLSLVPLVGLHFCSRRIGSNHNRDALGSNGASSGQ